jgi:hypothetical protein
MKRRAFLGSSMAMVAPAPAIAAGTWTRYRFDPSAAALHAFAAMLPVEIVSREKLSILGVADGIVTVG